MPTFPECGFEHPPIYYYRHHQQRHRSVPKLIYTQEFSDGLMIPNGRDDAIDCLDDGLAPLASFDDATAIAAVSNGQSAAVNGYVPSSQQFVLRNGGAGGRYHQRPRPMSELMSPMSEIHHPLRSSSARNGLAQRPNSVLEVMEPLMISSVPPLSPPPDFHTGTVTQI